MRHATRQPLPDHPALGRPLLDRTGERRPIARPAAGPRLASRARLTSIPRPPGAERHVDFVAYAAVRLGATAAEVADARAAGRAMRAKLDALRGGSAAPAPAKSAVRPAPGLLPFPADDFPAGDAPTPARPAPADSPRARRYTRGAAA